MWKGKVCKAGISFCIFVFFGDLALISFGNFVFLGLRSNSGSRQQSEVDLYLRGEDGLEKLTDYGFSFVVQAAHYVQRTAVWFRGRTQATARAWAISRRPTGRTWRESRETTASI
jgi:hypothetical protein